MHDFELLKTLNVKKKVKKFDYLQTQKAQKELKIIHKFSISLRHAHALSEVENAIRYYSFSCSASFFFPSNCIENERLKKFASQLMCRKQQRGSSNRSLASSWSKLEVCKFQKVFFFFVYFFSLNFRMFNQIKKKLPMVFAFWCFNCAHFRSIDLIEWSQVLHAFWCDEIRMSTANCVIIGFV